MRAMVADLGGWEKAEARFEAGEVKVNAWLGAATMQRARLKLAQLPQGCPARLA